MTPPRIQLTREIRFQLPRGDSELSPMQNSWTGWPKSLPLRPFVKIQCTLRGPVAVPTGYVCDVKTIDRMVRGASLELLMRAADESTDPFTLTQRLFSAIEDRFPPPTEVERITLCSTPCQSFTVCSENPSMTTLTHQFEFSAAHRLHCPELSDEENRQTFGKCNSPNGHGHNYVVDVSVRRPPGTRFDLSAFESIVCEKAIAELDHRHLNIDVPEFRELNPTVENIAMVICQKLQPHIEELQRVRVYETGKTWAEVEPPI